MANILKYLWITVMFLKAKGSNICFKDHQEESREISPRGYGYGGFGYPFLPFLEPLSILAVLGFLAFIVQTFHAIYHTQNFNNGGIGGLLNNVLPGHHKKLQPESRQNENIIQAIEYYETMNERKKSKKRTKFPKGNNVKSPTYQKPAT